MTLFVSNRNDIILSKVRKNFDKKDITNGNFLVSICEANAASVSGVSSHLTAPTVTLSADIGLADGDKVIINRVNGTISANGHFTVAGATATTFTILADTSSETYVEGGQVWKVLLEDAALEYDEVEESYLAIVPDSLELFPGREYLLFIEEANLGVKIEFSDTAQIRTS